MRADAIVGETDPQNQKSVIKSKVDYGENNSNQAMPTIEPADLVGRTFLQAPRDDGQRFHCKIVETIIENEGNLEKDPGLVKFRCSVNNEEYEEIVTYNDIVNHIERQEGGQDDDSVWKFRRITAHEGPLIVSNKSYNGLAYNVLVE
jgi:hypothetical protein